MYKQPNCVVTVTIVNSKLSDENFNRLNQTKFIKF